MAETVSAHELSTLSEMSSAQELGKLRKISTMQDIPLAEANLENENNLQQNLDPEMERKLKTGSLKRFFRLSPKKKSNNESLSSEKAHSEIMEETCQVVKNKQNSVVKIGDEEARETNLDSREAKPVLKRFKLRLGNNVDGNTEYGLAGAKELADSLSKTTLKSSLSTYWNSVFKLKKSKKSKINSELEQDDNLATTSDNLEKLIANKTISDDNNLSEDIQALKISERL